jgi:hypothetical protein
MGDVEDVFRLISRAKSFSQHQIDIKALGEHNNMPGCFRVELKDTAQLFKVRLGSRNPYGVETEYEALSILNDRGCEWAPKVREYSAPLLITTFAKGETLDSSCHWASHAGSIVLTLERALVEMHSVKGRRYGFASDVRYRTWRAFLKEHFWQSVLRVRSTGLIDAGDIRRIRRVYSLALEQIGEPPPKLLHGDIKPGNIVFDSELNKATLIDFELAQYGDVNLEWVALNQLSLRWPVYRHFIALPLLSRRICNFRWHEHPAWVLLYKLYHICLLWSFELEHKIIAPWYRIEDLSAILRLVHLRNR